MKYKNVVWDWNGTLLNDVKVGVNTLNDMLGRRGLPLLSVEDYKEKFGFPVIDAEVADALGFDCILFAGGHNNEERLQKKAPVIHRMRELLTCV